MAILDSGGFNGGLELVVCFARRDGSGRGHRFAQGFGLFVVWPDQLGQRGCYGQCFHKPSDDGCGCVQLDHFCQQIRVRALVDLDVCVILRKTQASALLGGPGLCGHFGGPHWAVRQQPNDGDGSLLATFVVRFVEASLDGLLDLENATDQPYFCDPDDGLDHGRQQL